jgi:putative endonuclease
MTLSKGKEAENLVIAWLKKQRFTILEENFRKKCGEIDIIAQKGNVIAFVEVKSSATDYFNLSHVIVPAKQRKIIKTAHWYIAQHNLSNTIYRFDVALVLHSVHNSTIEYIPNAFTQECE